MAMTEFHFRFLQANTETDALFKSYRYRQLGFIRNLLKEDPDALSDLKTALRKLTVERVLKTAEPLYKAALRFYLYGRSTRTAAFSKAGSRDKIQFAPIWERYGITREEYERLLKIFRNKFFWLTYADSISTIELVLKRLSYALKSGASMQAFIEETYRDLYKKVLYTETVFRTNAVSHYNYGIVEAYREDVQYFEYSAILDNRTTPICRSLHGKIVQAGSAEMSRIVPPNHYNCRSILIPTVIPTGERVTRRDISRLRLEHPEAADFIQPVYLDEIPPSVKERIESALSKRDIEAINRALEELLGEE